jgi:hypothetical protein
MRLHLTHRFATCRSQHCSQARVYRQFSEFKAKSYQSQGRKQEILFFLCCGFHTDAIYRLRANNFHGIVLLMGYATGAAELEKNMAYVDFEGVNFITAYRDADKDSIITRCNTQYTDIGKGERLDDFISRHGGHKGTAKYLAEQYRKETFA